MVPKSKCTSIIPDWIDFSVRFGYCCSYFLCGISFPIVVNYSPCDFTNSIHVPLFGFGFLQKGGNSTFGFTLLFVIIRFWSSSLTKLTLEETTQSKSNLLIS